ncbi:hypothetical protein [Moorella sp. E306M]|uniref:hypothetical protein n=1 Tax=Moorella sp. E306M TaxID=2572683 RepID=UPI0010FFC585|nr:hypothetical protein [Moorella sp. E306M]GEA17533.1 hypothetical protein E306M_06670 [Moorella sp. E306M]
MITDKEIEEIRIKVFEEFKSSIMGNANQPNGPYAELAVLIIESASKVCAKMLTEFAKRISEQP